MSLLERSLPARKVFRECVLGPVLADLRRQKVEPQTVNTPAFKAYPPPPLQELFCVWSIYFSFEHFPREFNHVRNLAISNGFKPLRPIGHRISASHASGLGYVVFVVLSLK